MTKEFVTYEQAIALKELGFDEPCVCLYDEDVYLFSVREQDDIYDYWTPAPSYSQAFRWFREKYNYNHLIIFTKNPFGTDEYQYMILLEDDECVEINFKTYEEAEQVCLTKLIEITNAEIKNRG
jgi:hypothetical protein